MKAVIQRVSRAAVRVGGEVVGAIDGPGLCVLLGVGQADTETAATAMADKVWRLRILADGDGVMNVSAADAGARILVVSQFTLYADVSRGRRPSWAGAARPEVAELLVDAFVDALRALGATVATGVFGADMQVELVNDGPVTILLET